jgi:hypothetical protein
MQPKMAVQQEQHKLREYGDNTQEIGSMGPGPKRRYERLCFDDRGVCALACKVGYMLSKGRGLKEGKLLVNNLCQLCG